MKWPDFSLDDIAWKRATAEFTNVHERAPNCLEEIQIVVRRAVAIKIELQRVGTTAYDKRVMNQ